MTRHTIAAGTLPSTIGYLSAWIADPQHPGNAMPNMGINRQDAQDITAYLYTLR